MPVAVDPLKYLTGFFVVNSPIEVFRRTRFHLFLGFVVFNLVEVFFSLFFLSLHIVWWLFCLVRGSPFVFNTLMRNRQAEGTKKTFLSFGSISFPSRSIIWMKFYVFFVNVKEEKRQEQFCFFLNIIWNSNFILPKKKSIKKLKTKKSRFKLKKTFLFRLRTSSMKWSTLRLRGEPMFLPFKYIQIYFMFFLFIFWRKTLKQLCSVFEDSRRVCLFFSRLSRSLAVVLTQLNVLEGELHLHKTTTRVYFTINSLGFLVYIWKRIVFQVVLCMQFVSYSTSFVCSL